MRTSESVLDHAPRSRGATRARPVNIPVRVRDAPPGCAPARRPVTATTVTQTTAAPRRGRSPQPRARRNRRSRTRTVLMDVVMLATVVVLAWALWPSNLGGWTSYVVVHGHSMDPTFTTGDLAIMRHESDYHVGEVVAYEIPQPSPIAGHLVIHRIVGTKSGGRFVLRGDNRTTKDAWFPTRADILGRLSVHAPVPGGERFWVLLPWGFCLLIGFGVMWVMWPRASDHARAFEGAGTAPLGGRNAPRGGETATASRRHRRAARAARFELACLVTGGVAVIGALVILIVPAT